MYFGVIIGIDGIGRYVTVRRVNGTIEVVSLSIIDVLDIGAIYFKDAFIESNYCNYLSSRMIKSLLLSFEDNLLVVDSAGILEVTDNEDGSCNVCLEVTTLKEPYSEYIKDIDKTRLFDVGDIVVRLNKKEKLEAVSDFGEYEM